MRAIVVALCIAFASAQTAYSVDFDKTLFSFRLSDPADISVIGTLPFLPRGIDFRPGTSELFAIVFNETSAQLWIIDITDASVTPVGVGFPLIGEGYIFDSSIGFDFNPKTLQADGSIRIRLVDTSGTNLRLHSATGLIASVDGSLNVGGTIITDISGVAYINNVPEMSGTTTLYALGPGQLYTISPPNDGDLNGVAAISQSFVNAQFDVYTNDDVNYAYAVLEVNWMSLLFSVDLFASSGSPVVTLQGIVGRSAIGGFAIDPLSTPDSSCATFPPTTAPLCNVDSSSCPTNFNNPRLNVCAFTSGVWAKRAFFNAAAREKLVSSLFGVPGEFYNGNCCDCNCSCTRVGFSIPALS